MNNRYDLVVVGAGSAGLTAATMARRLGASVALVEAGRVGGDCTWTGCVPSKALIHAAKVLHQMRHADSVGLSPAPIEVDLASVMYRVREAIDRVYSHETPEALAEQGVEVVLGAARFRNAHTLDLDGRILHGRRFVICTGAEPSSPPIPGLCNVPTLTYENVFDMRELPPRLLVLGGGPLGVEFAQAFQRLGSSVTILEQEDRILSIADPEASAVLAEVFAREGMRLCTGSRVAGVVSTPEGIRVVTAEESFEGDRLLVATGRKPQVGGLDLDRIGVDYDARGIRVDGKLRTSRRHIYAAGDVTGGYQFTHYAGWQGYVAARNALLPGAGRGARDTVPWVVFTDPEIGQAGLTEREARERGEKARVHRWPVERIDRAQTVGERTGFLKLVARPDGKLLGATVMAAVAGEVTNELALAIQRGLKLGDLAKTIHAYPTYGLSIQQLCAAATTERFTRSSRAPLLRALVRWWP